MSGNPPEVNFPTAPSMDGTRVFRVATLVVGTLALVILGINLRHYFPFFADDGFISLRYSERLLQGEGLTWTAGERVEGYSNLAYVLLTSFFGLFFDLVTAGRLVGVLGLIALARGVWLLRQANSPQANLTVSIIWLVMACVSSLAIWTIGGLEATLLAGLLILGYAQWNTPSLANAPWWRRALATWPLAVACLTRPDAPLFTAWLSACEVFRGRFGRRAWLQGLSAAFLPALATVGQLLFRLAYYGDWVPNTARIKAEPGMARWSQGLDYLGDAFQACSFLVALFVLSIYAAWIARHRRYETLLFGGAALAWLAYVASVGGDIFPGWRHALPAYALIGAGGFFGLQWLIGGARGDSRQLGGLAILLSGGLFTLFVAQRNDEGNGRAEKERWEWSAEPIGMLYRRFLPLDPLLGVEPAGALPYYSRLRALDMFGLCDRHIARQPARPHRALAHDHGDGAYVWRRRPDLLVYLMPFGGGPISASGQEFRAHPHYKNEYVEVPFLAVDPFDVRGRADVRLSGKLGIRSSDDAIVIPGYLMLGHDVVGFGQADGQVGALVSDSGGKSPPIEVDAGTWVIEVQGDPTLLQVAIKNLGKQAVDVDVAQHVVDVKERGLIEVQVRGSKGIESTLGRITLRSIRKEIATPLAVAPQNVQHVWGATTERATLLRHSEPIALENNHGAFIDGGEPLPRAGERKECAREIPGIDGTVRVDTYAMPELDRWQGQGQGPHFVIPERGLALACLSGARYNTGLRLRLRDSDEIIRSWSGTDSATVQFIVSDLAEYAGRPAVFEAFDQRDNAWGHTRVYGLGIVKRTSDDAPPSTVALAQDDVPPSAQ